MGLLGLMLLQESRRAARSTPEGELILLDHQDRSLWNREQIAEGIALTESALRSRRFGAYTLQAAIAAVHAEASSAASTDWHQIVLLYDRLLASSRRRSSSSIAPSPSPCTKVRSTGFVSSTTSSRATSSPATTSRTPPARTCAAGSGGLRRRALPTRRRLLSMRSAGAGATLPFGAARRVEIE